MVEAVDLNVGCSNEVLCEVFVCVVGSELDLYAFIEVHRCTPIRQEVSEKQNQFISTNCTRFLLLFEEGGRKDGWMDRWKREGNSAIFWSYFMPAIGGDQKHGPSYVVTVIFEKEDIVSERILVNTSRVLRETFPSPRLGEFRHKLLMKKEGTLHMGLRVAHGTKVCIF